MRFFAGKSVITPLREKYSPRWSGSTLISHTLARKLLKHEEDWPQEMVRYGVAAYLFEASAQETLERFDHLTNAGFHD